MKILVVGGGGRENAIVWKLKETREDLEIYCAPGNGGIAQIANCVDIKATDMENMLHFAVDSQIDFCIVAPDDPLAMGMIDEMEKRGIPAFGPSKLAAEIESSKVFSKQLMKKYGIPTADYEVFTDKDAAIEYIQNRNQYPIVVKADGLALGKGVVICHSLQEAKAALEDMMVNKIFGAAGSRVIVEEFITGPEVSVLAFTDSKTILPMVSAQDHKRAFDGDEGPNTGGMGAFAPSPKYTAEIAKFVEQNIMRPTVDAMAQEGRPFKGVLYFGLMLTAQGPKVLEYNARFGDPETQAVLPLLKNDLLEVFQAIREERLSEIVLEWNEGAAVCIVMASGGYPGKYPTGYEITGIEKAQAMDNVMVFHAGTKLQDGKLLTSGGRVLGVTARSTDMAGAIAQAYAAVEKIHFKDAHYRRDIGKK